MAIWRTPVFDRTMDDAKSLDRTSADYQKGALNADDLNRIEDNYKYLMAKLRSDAIFIPHRLRNYTETVLEYVQKEVNTLPEGCTRLPYIESTGTQYIDTSVKPNQDTRVVVVAELASVANEVIFGTRSTNYNYYIQAYTGNVARVGYGTSAVVTSLPINPSVKYTFELNKNVVSVGENNYSFSNQTFTEPNNLYLLGLNNRGEFGSGALAKLFSCQIYDNDTLMHDYIPILDSAGVPCLYDRVTETYLYNAGTGEFGYVIPRRLPEGYTQVEYIESSGTQYINTNFIPTPNTEVRVDIDFLSGNSSFNCIFGVGQTASNQFVVYRNSSNMVGQIYSTKTYTSSEITNTGRRECILSNSKFQYGTYSTAVTQESFSYTYPLYLFSMNSVGNATLNAHMRLYSCQIDDNGVLIRDYIPCTNESDEAGLYDLVENKFYANAGTGVFITGDEVEPEFEIDIVEELIEVTTTYTDWQEHNLPWLSEINRIRANYNALVRLFLVKLGLPISKESNFLYYTEVNDWERIAAVGKTMYENMEKEYRYCGTEESGGGRLL